MLVYSFAGPLSLNRADMFLLLVSAAFAILTLANNNLCHNSVNIIRKCGSADLSGKDHSTLL